MSTLNLCFDQKYEKYENFLTDFFFQFLVIKFSVYLNRHVFVMVTARLTAVMNIVFEPSWNRRVKNFLCPTSSDITKTRLYNFNPLKPNFYI